MSCFKKFSLLLAIVIAGTAIGGFSAPVSAAPPVPSLMPGFPMQAGSVVMVMWAPVPGGVKYRIYLGDQAIGEAAMPPFQTTAPEGPGEYKYTVTSLDASGSESAKSVPGVIRIVGLEPPKEISGMFDPANKQVVLRWGTATGATIYNLYRSEKEGDTGKLLQSLQDTRYVDKAVEANRKYYYRVTGKDVTGKESKPSSLYKVDTTVEEKVVATQKVVKLVPIPVAVVSESTKFSNYPSDIQFLKDGSVYVSIDSLVFLESAGASEIKKTGEKFPGVVGLGETRDGNLLVVQRSINRVSVVEPVTGVVRFSFPVPELREPFTFEGHTVTIGVPTPYDAVQLANGNYVVTDTVNNRVVLLDPQGKFLKNCGQDNNHHILPGAGYIARSPTGDIYAVAGVANKVVIFDSSCNYKGEFGDSGNVVGTFGRIQGVYVDPSGNVWVADLMNSTVQKFSPSGDFLGVLTDETKKGSAKVFTPIGISVRGNGKDVYVSESITKVLKHLKIVE